MALSVAAELLRAGVAVELVAKGGSMAPLLCGDDLLYVEPMAASGLALDDIAVIETARGLLAHRVVGLAPLFTRGDRLEDLDMRAPAEAVVGRVRALRRWGLVISLKSAGGALFAELTGLFICAWRRFV